MTPPVPYAIQPNTGGPLDPNDIIGRDQICRQIVIDFEAGDQRLVDPRRLGKTSLIRRLPIAIADDRVTIVEIDFQGSTSSDGFYSRLVDGLARHTTFGRRFRHATRSFIENVELGTSMEGVTIKTSLQHVPKLDVLQQILDSVRANLSPDELLVIVCDEVPMAIELIHAERGAAEARSILQTLRALRSKQSRVKWLITGSIGFHHVVRLVGGTEGDYNDLATVQMGPLAEQDAEFLAECLLLGVGRAGDADTAATMAELSGGIPYLIHHIANLLPRTGTAATPDEVEVGFDAFVRDRDTSSALTHLVTRLGTYYADDDEFAAKALDVLAIATSPLSVAEIRKELGSKRDVSRLGAILDMLEDDHYLTTDRNGIRWRYDVLRRIWVVRRRLV